MQTLFQTLCSNHPDDTTLLECDFFSNDFVSVVESLAKDAPLDIVSQLKSIISATSVSTETF